MRNLLIYFYCGLTCIYLLTCLLQAEIEQLRVRATEQLRELDELQTDYNGE